MRAAIALAWLLCLTHVIAIAASKIEVTSKAVRQSVVKALPLLARTGPTTFKKSGCVSCHNQSLPAVAMAMARERGLTVEEEAVREILRTSVAAFGLDAETRLQMGEVLGRTITIGYALLGLAAENHRPDKATDSMALWTARTQFADGSWHDSDHRPPMEYSRFTATALGLRSLQLYGPPTRREEFEGRVELARDWLVRHQPRDTEGRTFLLLGLAWAGAPEKAIRQAADDLIESQRPDGGWAQLVSLESDAYATGQALYALHTAGRVPVAGHVIKPINEEPRTCLRNNSTTDPGGLAPVRSPFSPISRGDSRTGRTSGSPPPPRVGPPWRSRSLFGPSRSQNKRFLGRAADTPCLQARRLIPAEVLSFHVPSG